MEEIRSEDYATAYINIQRAFSRNRTIMEQKLDSEWTGIDTMLQKCPGSLSFLNEQKKAYDKRINQFLKNNGRYTGKITSDDYWKYGINCLSDIKPATEKQTSIRDSTLELAKHTCIITSGFEDIRKKEWTELRKKRVPIVFNGFLDNVRDIPTHYLMPEKITRKDIDFLTYYNRILEAFWCENSGIAPYTHEPIELNISEKIDSLAFRHFYEQISDSTYSLFKYTSGLVSVGDAYIKRWIQ